MTLMLLQRESVIYLLYINEKLCLIFYINF